MEGAGKAEKELSLGGFERTEIYRRGRVEYRDGKCNRWVGVTVVVSLHDNTLGLWKRL